MFCHSCGQRNPEGVNFCSACGNALLGDGEAATITLHPNEEHSESHEETPDVAMGEVPHGSGVLVVTRGSVTGDRFVVGDTVIRAGRHPESDIFLDDITVSRRHVEITPEADGSVSLRDVGSLNGTYVNRERIDQVQLKSGDEVQIGKFKLVYLVGGNE